MCARRVYRNDGALAPGEAHTPPAHTCSREIITGRPAGRRACVRACSAVRITSAHARAKRRHEATSAVGVADTEPAQTATNGRREGGAERSERVPSAARNVDTVPEFIRFMLSLYANLKAVPGHRPKAAAFDYKLDTSEPRQCMLIMGNRFGTQ